MRSLEEIRFRLRQELVNLFRYVVPPGTHAEISPPPLAGLPNPAHIVDQLRGSPFAAEVVRLADDVMAHRFPIFGQVIETGPEIGWNRDYRNQRSGKQVYFRRVPYLDFERVGDHKWVWEFNRHQHLVLLAQAALFTGDDGYTAEIARQLSSWTSQNPFQRGINWASALEVAFRALSWIWVYHLAGARLGPDSRPKLLEGIYQHGAHLENNLSIYFSPNTHLLGEAVVLHAIGRLFPQFERSNRWRVIGRQIVLEEMGRQVRDDGSHFEQSSYYHVYALDMFLFHHILEPAPPRYVEKLREMADYLDALMGPGRRLPFLGDDDGGRMFHPYGDRDGFGRATLATCGQIFPASDWKFTSVDLAEQASWWLGSCRRREGAGTSGRSRWFSGSGVAVMTDGIVHVLVDAGPFGSGSAGHSHSDALSVVAYRGAEEILIDPGACSYMAGDERNTFRGSAAHNTVRVDSRDQAEALGPFVWAHPAAVTLKQWSAQPTTDFLDAECGGHRRRVVFAKEASVLFVFDDVSQPGGRVVEQFWHLASETLSERLRFTQQHKTIADWRSRVYGSKEAAPTLRVSREGPGPWELAAAIDVSGAPANAAFERNGEVATWTGRGLKVTVTLEPDIPRVSIDRQDDNER